MLLGQAMSGFVGPSFGWRIPFLAASLPTVALAFVVYFTVAEPERGRSETALQSKFKSRKKFEYKSTLSLRKVQGIFKIKTNILGFLQGVPGCMPWATINTYLNDYLAQDRGMGVAAATSVLLFFGAGGAVGGITGGFVGQTIYNRRKRMLPIFAGTGVILGIFPMLYLIDGSSSMGSVSKSEDAACNETQLLLHSNESESDFHVDGAYALACIFSLLGGFLSTIAGPNIRAVMLNVNTPETRGTVFSIFALTDDLGKGLGPMIGAALVGYFGSRKVAFNATMFAWVACGTLMMMQFFTIEADERRMQESLYRASDAEDGDVEMIDEKRAD